MGIETLDRGVNIYEAVFRTHPDTVNAISHYYSVTWIFQCKFHISLKFNQVKLELFFIS